MLGRPRGPAGIAVNGLFLRAGLPLIALRVELAGGVVRQTDLRAAGAGRLVAADGSILDDVPIREVSNA